MSHLSSVSQDPIHAAVPIVKFSHNICAVETRNFTWTHVSSRNDLQLLVRGTKVIDDYGNHKERLFMKVTAGSEVLENQDLGSLVQICQETTPLPGVEQPVQVVIKSPFMAMRYPKTASTIRRLQVKFHNESDFAKALDIMQGLGLPVTVSIPVPQTIAPTRSIASSARHSLASNVATAVPHPRRSTPAITSKPNTVDLSLSTSSISHFNSEFKVPLRADSASSEASRPFSAMSASSSTVPRTASASSASTLPKPPTSSLCPPQIMKEEQSQGFPLSYTEQIDGQEHMVSRYETASSQQEDDAPGRKEYEVSPFFGAPQERSLIYFPLQSATSSPVILNTGHAKLDNPGQSASIAIVDKLTCLGLTKQNSTIDSYGAQVSSVNLSPLPKPTPVTRAQSTIIEQRASQEKNPSLGQKAGKRVAQRQSTNVTQSHVSEANREIAKCSLAEKGSLPKDLTKMAITFEPSAPPEDEPSPLAAKSAAVALGPRPASAMAGLGLQSKAATSARKRTSAAPIRPSLAVKRPRMIDQATQTQTFSGRDHTTALVRLPPPLNMGNPPSLSETYLNAIDTLITQHKERPAPKELYTTPGYAEGDETQRLAMLNDFICENLENQDFLKLCQDTEKSWRRIGLGM